MIDPTFIVSDVKNPVFVAADHSEILCTVFFPNPPVGKDGIPFHARADDCMPHGSQLWHELNAGKYGPIGPFVPPAK